MTAQILTLPKIRDFKLLQASGAFSYRFEELGLEIEGGFSAGSFNGTAQITYWNDPEGLEWFVGDIVLDCSRWNGKSWDAKQIELEVEDRLYLAIWGVLSEGAFKDSIEAKVEEQI